MAFFETGEPWMRMAGQMANTPYRGDDDAAQEFSRAQMMDAMFMPRTPGMGGMGAPQYMPNEAGVGNAPPITRMDSAGPEGYQPEGLGSRMQQYQDMARRLFPTTPFGGTRWGQAHPQAAGVLGNILLGASQLHPGMTPADSIRIAAGAALAPSQYAREQTIRQAQFPMQMLGPQMAMQREMAMTDYYRQHGDYLRRMAQYHETDEARKSRQFSEKLAADQVKGQHLANPTLIAIRASGGKTGIDAVDALDPEAAKSALAVLRPQHPTAFSEFAAQFPEGTTPKEISDAWEQHQIRVAGGTAAGRHAALDPIQEAKGMVDSQVRNIQSKEFTPYETWSKDPANRMRFFDKDGFNTQKAQAAWQKEVSDPANKKIADIHRLHEEWMQKGGGLRFQEYLDAHTADRGASLGFAPSAPAGAVAPAQGELLPGLPWK